jgi:hypothetical protein
MSQKPQQNVEIVHDRRAEILPFQDTGVATDCVDDPYGVGKINVIRSVRDDPLAGMHSRRFIDDAQFAAGRHWQQCWEDSEIGQVRAIDTTKEPVDGGGASCTPFTDKQREAFRELQLASVVLGYEGDMIIREVLAQRMSLKDVGLKHHRPKKFIGQRFRECLESMAKLWSYA